MEVKGKNILVTGAGGFIGSHLVEELVKLGANVTAFLRYNSYNNWELIEELPKEIKEKIIIIMGDLKDPDSVRNACKGKDIIFHLGALIAIPYSYVNPRDHVETNVMGTLNVMIGAKEHNVKKIIHTSTSEVYGTAQYTPIDEKHPLQGQSPYSASKIGADKIVESFYLSYNLPIVTVRPFNTFGPRQSARAIIPTIISQALTNGNVKLGSLTPKRDFTYVKDTVNGFIKAAFSEEAIGQVINLGSGKKISMGELANTIFSILEKDCKIIEDKSRIRPEKSEVMELIAETKKANEILDWQPKVRFEEGLRYTIEYVKENISKFKTDKYNI